MRLDCAVIATLLSLGSACVAVGQEYGKPDRQSPGDPMIQRYLARETEKIENHWLEGVKSVEDWEKLLPRYKKEYLYMLGLEPMPAKTPLEPKITGRIDRDGYVVEMIHYQSRPRLYVTGNLYRPTNVKTGERLPAVLYVCGHSNMGRNGNKTDYQSHAIWLAKHGYVCLVVDTLQLGEIAAIHHGTYKENRWWWHSRGYTPAGVECWNGIRGIDYLVSRPDVDPQRIAVTGISGGGAATHWIAAADQRVKVAVPVSGMADFRSYVTNRTVNGHCDCMFLYNVFQWPCALIDALIAPRPLLFTNSDADAIFPMDANDRVINRLERAYSLYGAGDMVDAMVSIGGHAYRKDLRQAEYRFINMHLKSDPRVVEDSEIDLVDRQEKAFPIAPEKLRVFPSDSDLPKDELNTKIDQFFVPMAEVSPFKAGQFESWKKGLLDELRQVTFRYFPERIPAARLIVAELPGEFRLQTEPGIEVYLELVIEGSTRFLGRQPVRPERVGRILLQVRGTEDKGTPSRWALSAWAAGLYKAGDITYRCDPRGVERTRWTRNNPPNYVERCLPLLGRTVDTCRVWDVIATARYLYAKYDGKVPVYVYGEGPVGLLAAYAALLEPEIAGVMLNRPPLGHMEPDAPQFLNVLRVCDVPTALGMLAPKELTIGGIQGGRLHAVTAAYAAAGQPERLVLQTE